MDGTARVWDIGGIPLSRRGDSHTYSNRHTNRYQYPNAHQHPNSHGRSLPGFQNHHHPALANG